MIQHPTRAAYRIKKQTYSNHKFLILFGAHRPQITQAQYRPYLKIIGETIVYLVFRLYGTVRGFLIRYLQYLPAHASDVA